MPERIAIMGAGAVGGYVGGHLIRLGHDVVLIDPRPEHVEVMRRVAWSSMACRTTSVARSERGRCT